MRHCTVYDNLEIGLKRISVQGSSGQKWISGSRGPKIGTWFRHGL